MNVITIRCIANESKGFGNLSRAILLAKELKKNSNKIIFLIDKNLNAKKILQSNNLKYFFVPQFTSKKKESEFIIKKMNSVKSKSVILEMREFSEILSKYLKNYGKQVIIIDDAWVKNLYADLIFNGTVVKKYHKYKKINQNAEIFTGSKFWIADQHFLKNQKKQSSIKSKSSYSIVITMGGADNEGIIIKILNYLGNVNFIKFYIVIGPMFKKHNELKPFFNLKNITFLNSPKQIWKIFEKSDVVICNGGNTLFELLIQRIPTLCIPAISHQIPYAKFFHSKGITINLGYWEKLNGKKFLKHLELILEDENKRKNMSRLSSKILDGKGLLRVTKIINKNLI